MYIFLKVLNEYDGIIGTILGVVATLITTDWLQHRGKLNIFIMKWTGKYETYYDVGCSHKGKEETDLYGYCNEFEIEVYNSSSIPKIMRNVKIEFYDNKELKYSNEIKDEDTRRYTSHITTIDKFEVINFKPKEVVKLKLSNYIHEDELIEIEGTNRIFLTYVDENNKKNKILIHNGLITSKNLKE